MLLNKGRSVRQIQMSKKSYKQLQNRLYREIKRRIIAEQRKVKLQVIHFPIETLRIEKRLAYPLRRDDATVSDILAYTRSDIANEIGKKLLADGYIKVFVLEDSQSDPLNNQFLVRGELKVVKPEERER